DSEESTSLASDRLQLHCTDILMRSSEDKAPIARSTLAFACPEILTETVAEQSWRTEFAQAMLADVLEQVASFGADDVSLVTSDSCALELTQRFGFDVIRDYSSRSEEH